MSRSNKKPPRRSIDLVTPGGPSKRARFSLDSNSTLDEDSDFTTEALARKLDSLNPDVFKENQTVKVELDGIEKDSETADEYQSKREELRKQVGTFDVHGKTALDMSSAAIAGAKMMLDEKRASRSLSRKILENTGIPEEQILYSGLQGSGKELTVAKEVATARQAYVAESLADYRNQIKFKSIVLSKISQSEKPWRKADEKKRIRVPRDKWKFTTPRKKCVMNPLDCERIVDKYALEVASDIRSMDSNVEARRRQIAPIPFQLNDSDCEADKQDDK